MTKPASHWSGLDLTPLPHESFPSVLQLFAWRNALDRKTLRAVFRVERKERRLDIARLAAETHGEIMQTRYLEAELAGYGTWAHPRFRFCPICIEACYHSGLFQCLQLLQCPIHDVALTACCQVCGAQTPVIGERDVLFERPYECDACHRPYGGAAPTLEAHLALRSSQAILTEHLRPYASWWKTESDRRSEIDAMRCIKRTSLHGRWGQVEDILRSLMGPISPKLRHLQSASPWASTTRLCWRYRAQLHSPSDRTHQRGFLYVPVRFAHIETTMYRSTLKQILRWLYHRTGLSEAEVLGPLAQFDEGHTENMPPELLAFGVVRLQIECGWRPGADGGYHRPENARPMEGIWHIFEPSGGRMPRIAWRAAILALYAAWYHIARRSSHTALWQLIRNQPKTHSLVLLRCQVWCKMGEDWRPGNFPGAQEAWYDGEVAFVGIPGLALFPRIARPVRQRQPPPWRPEQRET